VSIAKADSSIEVPTLRWSSWCTIGCRGQGLVHSSSPVGCLRGRDKQDSVTDIENDQGARLAKNRGLALQSFAAVTDMDLEQT